MNNTSRPIISTAKIAHNRQNQTRFCVVLSADENYIKYASVVMLSILAHTKSHIDFYLLHDGSLKDSTLMRLKLLESARARITALKVPTRAFVSAPTQGEGQNHITYLRLLLGSVLPQEIRTCLHIDCDVLVCEDIAKLFAYNLGDAMLGAVRDLAFNSAAQACQNYGEFYFNAGVLRIDLDKWRAQNAQEHLLDTLSTSPEIAQGFHDQNLLNHCFYNQTKELPLEWNFIYAPDCIVTHYPEKLLAQLQDTAKSRHIPAIYPESKSTENQSAQDSPLIARHSLERFEKALQSPKIIHFAAQPKPWTRLCYIKESASGRFALITHENPFSKRWWGVAQASPFHKELKATYAIHTRAMYKTKLLFLCKKLPFYNALRTLIKNFMNMKHRGIS